MIDWTKPIQLEDGTPMTYVGQFGGSRIVGTTGARYGLYYCDDDGKHHLYGSNNVVNVPPPSVWPKEAWIVTCSAGTAHLVREKVRCKTVMNSLKNLGRSVKVTPVTLTGPFDGPPSKS